MYRKHNMSVVQRYLSKNKKYYSQKANPKDKENILAHDINQIIESLSNDQKKIRLPILSSKKRVPLSILNSISNRNSAQKSKLSENSLNFFQHEKAELLEKKKIKKQIAYYINKIRQPIKSKCSIYQQYITLSQESNDFLEYYLTNFSGEDSGKAIDLLRQQGKNIVLMILKRKYKCFGQNQSDICNRIFLAFNLNPLNNFQFVSWEKFMRIRKLISGDFNRKDCADFLIGYLYVDSTKLLVGNEIWLIFSSALRKLNCIVDATHLQIILDRVKQQLFEIIGKEKSIGRQECYRTILQEPMFIWFQLVTLVFL